MFLKRLLERYGIAFYSCGDGLGKFIFLHGNCQNYTAGFNLYKFFLSRGYEIFSFDMYGHGNSPPSESRGSKIDLFSDILDQLIKSCRLDSPIIAGHSFGGMVLLNYMSKADAPIKSGILISTASRNPILDKPELKTEVDEILDASSKKFAFQYAHDFSAYSKMSEEEIHLAGLFHTDPKSLDANFVSAERFDVSDTLEKIHQPVLIIRGSKDPFMTENNNRRMLENLYMAKYEELPECGHNLHINKGRELLYAIERNSGLLMI